MDDPRRLVCDVSVSVEALLSCLIANKPVFASPIRAETAVKTLKTRGLNVEASDTWANFKELSVTDDNKLLFVMQRTGHKQSDWLNSLFVTVSESALKHLLVTDEAIGVLISHRSKVETFARTQSPPIHLDMYADNDGYVIRRTNDARLRKLMGLPV